MIYLFQDLTNLAKTIGGGACIPGQCIVAEVA
jgi:hypothetical protein